MRFTFLLLLLLVDLTIHAQSFKTLVWSEEFNYKGLPDTTRWNYEVGVIRNNEAQYYMFANPKNAVVKKGNLVISAIKENYDKAKYTSASIHTDKTKSFLYGRIEVRAKLPMGRGTWPAIWLLGSQCGEVQWPACGEIDIMENVGFDSIHIHANVHTEAYNHVKKNNKGNKIVVNKPWDTFHVYAIEWSPDTINFFVDNNLNFTYTKEPNATNAEWPFDKPHYLIINLAIGGAWGGQKGIDDTKFPHRYFIDYVRVYQ